MQFQFLLIETVYRSNMHIWGWLGSGLLVVITWILTVHTITQHLTNYNNKGIQRHKVRVLAYPAVYSTLAWQVD